MATARHETVLSIALNKGRDSERIEVVFYVYKEESIKNAERERRGSTAGHEFGNWQKERYREKLSGKKLFVTNNELCLEISSTGTRIRVNLKSTQEEADTRILLHASHAAKAGYAIVISSEDTDVLVIALSLKSFIASPLFIKTTKQSRTYVDVSKVVLVIGVQMCIALPGFHAFTGCERASAFFGKGKAKALELLHQNSSFVNLFLEMGMYWQLDEELFQKIQEFTCTMYSYLAGTSDVNKLRNSCMHYVLTIKLRYGEEVYNPVPSCMHYVLTIKLRYGEEVYNPVPSCMHYVLTIKLRYGEVYNPVPSCMHYVLTIELRYGEVYNPVPSCMHYVLTIKLRYGEEVYNPVPSCMHYVLTIELRYGEEVYNPVPSCMHYVLTIELRYGEVYNPVPSCMHYVLTIELRYGEVYNPVPSCMHYVLTIKLRYGEEVYNPVPSCMHYVLTIELRYGEEVYNPVPSCMHYVLTIELRYGEEVYNPVPKFPLQLATKTCSTPKCTCVSSGLKCTDMCKLLNCENRTPEDEEEEENDPADNQEENSDKEAED
ncbi:predicted protein [Nematostella vectensis]|uniref:Uncharacterized protein n=1 Tax=Nematostella vectensis TaxID=45351 RepID=A7T5F7_NEMVE|nr:predicted protein [Nematostella vectensis]|eukprot:XP_001620906.1 hypothetical protein NEMVEDRAFT_v1g222583 [Nematostella vectensis]